MSTTPDGPGTRGGTASRRAVGFNSWRAAIRIARRDAWRSKGRSAMVLAMIALPIVGVSAADITIRSSQLSPEQQITRDMGAADARLSDGFTGGQPLYQDPLANSSLSVKVATTLPSDSADGDASYEEPKPIDPRTGLPPGARWLSDSQIYASFRTKYGLLETPVRELKADDPMARGITDLDRGRYPATDDEVIATSHFLKSSGLHVGSKVAARDLDRTYRIVGAYDLPDELKTDQLIARPGAFIAAYRAARQAVNGVVTDGSTTSYLASVPGDYTWKMVRQTNTKGVTVRSRAVRLHIPADSEVPLYATPQGARGSSSGSSNAEKAAAVTVTATIVGLAMLEICLLAGPAFAVGARRSRRQLGLVGANGGDRRHIRAIVLSGGLVIGAVAAVTGTVLGLLMTVVLRSPLENYVGKRFGGLTLRPAELLGIAVLAVLTGLLAAVVPAITASRQSVLTSLTGRRGVRHANRVLPVIGLGAVLLGAGIALFGSMRTDSTLAVGGGSGIAELGVVALTPTLVGMFGKAGKWLPLAPRLALRDAVRNRGRTAPAVAAVLAAVAGTVAVATYSASADRQDRDLYEARLPSSVLAVTATSDHGRDLPAVRAAVEKRYPVSGRADVSAMVVGGEKCDASYIGDHCGYVQIVKPAANMCPTETPDGTANLSLAQRRALVDDWRCASNNAGNAAIASDNGVLIGGPAVLHALGIRDGAAERALARGETVLFDKAYDDHGKIKIKVTLDASKTVPEGKDSIGPVKYLPVHRAAENVTASYGVIAVAPQKAVDSVGIRTISLGSFYTNSRMPNGHERQALAGDIAKIGTDAQVYLERGYTADNSLILLALTIFAGLVTIGAAGIATGLAQADAEPDLKTLAAIGAAPRVRRTLSGFQCGVIATMGVVLGSAAGILPAVGLRHTERRREWQFYHQSLDSGWGSPSQLPHIPIVVPWSTLALLIVAVPLGATLLAAVVTRSRTQLARRAEP